MSLTEMITDSTVPAVVTNPRLPDNPIVDCNAAFLALTGYTREEVVGRNCRFLSGPETEDAGTNMIRAALRDRRPVLVELRNHRKDGSAFRNAVMIAPIFGPDGTLEWYLGSQMAVEHGGERRRDAAAALIDTLTERQRAVLAGMADGRLNKQIAYELGLTERTVKMHRAAMLRALGVRSMAEAIRLAIEAGL
ncbi:LuxR C-terminal-related transcriptional regulator [Sphingobium sp. CR2-8]|uniref:LuxR C-terminal-related transcriptional regulator n=1 Tax=Sphingobium sp. CR2-8 TaxID=1306534 RepID=UPI002DB5628C|nr:LuxR C-terminal-related transcriptional regulator [Sphingobium sp. CR2-8]MEC3910181.1 LuxR C-terminal-related transcriptional regulator [Sphingobium sp. CR2-8]